MRCTLNEINAASAGCEWNKVPSVSTCLKCPLLRAAAVPKCAPLCAEVSQPAKVLTSNDVAAAPFYDYNHFDFIFCNNIIPRDARVTRETFSFCHDKHVTSITPTTALIRDEGCAHQILAGRGSWQRVNFSLARSASGRQKNVLLCDASFVISRRTR